MATYIMLSTLTETGRATLQQRPERIREVNREIEALGARVTDQWAVLGPYDFVNLVEAPDNETIARVSVALGARGTVQLLTLPAVPLDGFIAALAGGSRAAGADDRGGAATGRGDGEGRDAGSGREHLANPIQVQKFLSGADYPVSKADLVRIADEEGADEAVRATLARLPERQYDSPVAVSEEIGKFE